MPVTFNSRIFRLSGDNIQQLAPFFAVLLKPSHDPMLTLEVSTGTQDELLDAVESIARQMDDPDRIAAIRMDENACCAELDVAARPVDPRRLH